ELKNTQAQLFQSGKLASIGQLAAGVAHEINNPITFVMLNAPIFEKVWNSVTPILEEYCRSNGDFRVSGMSYTQLEERVPLLLKDIKEGAMRVKRIVEDLKDFARQGPSDLTDMVDVNSTIKAAVGLVSNQIKKSTDYFEVEYGLDIPKFKGNTQRIEQVIINLLVNACQALPDKERSIQISTAYDKESSNVLVQVRDQGVGMSAEVLQRIKDPFFTTNRESGGTGLGLVISERIIEDHCGTMKLDSSPGKGTTVTVSLPANPSSEGRNRDEEVK
ncbi:MAG: histidine kinase, partial [Deltaproteobacteria bacterium]